MGNYKSTMPAQYASSWLYAIFYDHGNLKTLFMIIYREDRGAYYNGTIWNQRKK